MQTDSTIPSLSIQGLHAGYPGKRVLSGLDLPPLESGKVTALTGPNAAGKSTLLRALAGLIQAKGSINYDGTELLGISSRKRASYISFMPQSVPTDINLSVIEAVISALKASPLDSVSIGNELLHQKALNALSRIGISHLALESLSHLSGGQRQMASLARTVVREPKILLLDEPTSALDLRHQVKVMKLARSFAADGRVVIIVLHDLNLALRWADHVVVMDKGKMVGYGKPADAITSQLIAQVYGVRIRVENCSASLPHLIVDDEV